MIQYIPKDALLAEIERLKGSLSPNFYEYDYDAAKVELLEKIEKFLNTFKVKEVDLDKEIDNIWNPRFNLGWDEKSLLSINHEGFTTIAKHFIEIGINLQKDNELTWEDISKIREIFCGMVGYPLISDKEVCTEVLERYKAQKRE